MVTTLRNFASVLRIEIEEAKKSDIVITFVPIKRLNKGEPKVYYCLTEDEIKLPDGSIVKIQGQDGKLNNAEILASKDFSLIIATELDLELGKTYKLRYNLAWILEAMLQWIEDPKPNSNWSIAKGVLQASEQFILKDYGTPSVFVNEGLNDHQFDAVLHAMRHNLTFIWGPPGTGKSRTLSEIITNYLADGLSVLFISQSNVAVDIVASQVLNYDDHSIEKLRMEGHLIRSGYPSLEPFEQWNDMLPYHIVLRDNPRLAEHKIKLEKEKSRLLKKLKRGEKTEENIEAISTQLAQIKQSVKDKVEELESKAPFVATTLAKLSLSKTLKSRTFDAVVVDEASMLNIPTVFMAFSLAKFHCVVAGDFLQLQPIHLSKKGAVPRWLGRSVFNTTGIREKAINRQPDPRLVVLKRQYRMADEISALVNGLFYGGILENAPFEERNIHPQADLFKEERLIFVDTSSEGECHRDLNSNSRINSHTALLSVDLAKKTIKDKALSVGIITPYRAQAKKIRDIITQEELGELVDVSTVHKFQGSEKDVIIFDLADSFPQKSPSVLLSGSKDGFYEKNSPTLPLLNVALSRAKSQVIVLGDLNYFKNKTTNSNMVLTTFKHMEEMGLYWGLKDDTFRKQKRNNQPTQLGKPEGLEEPKFDKRKAEILLNCICGGTTILKKKHGYYSQCVKCRKNIPLNDVYLIAYLGYHQPKCPKCSGLIFGELEHRFPKLACVQCGKGLSYTEIEEVLLSS